MRKETEGKEDGNQYSNSPLLKNYDQKNLRVTLNINECLAVYFKIEIYVECKKKLNLTEIIEETIFQIDKF